MTSSKIKRLVIRNLPYLLLLWFFNKVGEAYRLSVGRDAAHRLMDAINNLNSTLANPIPSLDPFDSVVGLAGAVIVYGIVQYKRKNAKKWRADVEYGSARWGTRKDIEPYIDPKPENNVILTATESLTMESRPKLPKHARNKNVLIIGGSGSGKTRFFVKPNILQLHSSYCITDPKGGLVYETASLLERKGYKIKIMNTIDMGRSLRYNPFTYLRKESDILKLVTALVENTRTSDNKGGDPFWEQSEKMLYCALIGYIFYEANDEEKSMNSLVAMINSMEVRENEEALGRSYRTSTT
ncbi:MAG: type IV secretory system conjugative DNA transfer family protein [Defluviitaleaceae bacterium]|nr:type IV secretory system conjugative DNA transfer family protein [Defluviitaleaceae bacterium]